MTQKKRVKLVAVIICAILTVGILSMSTFSFVKLGTFNFSKAVMALISISCGNDKYVEIKSAPNKTIIATPDNAIQVFEGYMAENSYTILESEQLGSLIVVLRDGKRETVAFSVNKYWSLWQWVDVE